jgi:phenylpropionate dioxygenase-like ring-hydroxylating dioxygenase large terminal subunit
MNHELQVTIIKELMSQLDEGRNIDAGVQYKMPTQSYVCPEIAAQEQSHFFMDHPQLIGLSGDLPAPGSFLTLDDFGVPILATRDKSGVFHAFLNACRHRSVKVAQEERGTKHVFTCPFHHWSYANSGELITIPNNDHFGDVDKSCRGLIELPCAEESGLLWVHPNPQGSLDLGTLLGGLSTEFPSFEMERQVSVGQTTIDKALNWKFANDTFGETYHFGKLHKDTLGRLYYGNNLHFEEFGRHHRFVTANRGMEAMRQLPEAEWNISKCTFVLYHLFPNVQLITSKASTTLIRIYPVKGEPSRSITRISFYYAPELASEASDLDDESRKDRDAYDFEGERASLSNALEVFKSTVENEDYAMGEMQQRAAESGLLKEIIFGRNEPALHHFHNNYREALGQPLLQRL